MMKCGNCGRELAEGAKYCDKCGKLVALSALEDESANVSAAPASVHADANNNDIVNVVEQIATNESSFAPGTGMSQVISAKGKKRRRGIAIGIISIAVCVLVVVCLVLPHFSSISRGVDFGSESPYSEVFTDDFYYSESRDEHIAQEEDSASKYVDNEIILFANQGATREDVLNAFDGYNADIVGYMDAVDFYQIRFSSSFTKAELDEIADMAGEDEAIDEAFVNRVDFLSDAFTYEPEYSDYATPTWALEAIHAYDAWNEIGASQTVNVGILDTQFYDLHEDLEDSFVKTVPSRDVMFVANDGTGALPDDGEHGTHVAGIIGAQHNDIGIDGICDTCNLYGYTVWGTEAGGAHRNGSTTMLVGGLVYLIDDCDCKVVNISMGSDSQTSATSGDTAAQSELRQQDRIYEKLLKALIAKGHDDFVICHCAGNEGEDGDAGWQMFSHIEDPKVSSRIITVGSLEPCAADEYEVSEYSCGGSDVDVVAPGTDVYSTVYSLTEEGKSGIAYSDYKYGTGTSMATPAVSGVAALVLSANPELKGDQVARIIVDTVTAERYVDNQGMSHGCVDAYAAVKKALSYSQTATETDDDNWVNQSETENEVLAKYQEALMSLKTNHVLPSGEEVESFSDLDASENEFCIADVDGDGRPELIIEWTYASTAGMRGGVYEYDAQTDAWRTEIESFPAYTFFDNGWLEVLASHDHNQEPSQIWPYSACEYDASSDTYILAATLYWSDGITASVSWGEDASGPSKEPYSDFIDSTTGSGREMPLKLLKLTDENISSVSIS